MRNQGTTSMERALIKQIEGGLPLVSRPYAEIATRLGVTESHVIDRVTQLMQEGAIKRMGVVVRHWELGYHASAMVVWNVPDQKVDEMGERFGKMPFVTLCYRRPRRPPIWQYNLFTMIHGYDREHVKCQVDQLVELSLEPSLPHEILFSLRRFKQRGARYSALSEQLNTAKESAAAGDNQGLRA